MAKLPDRGYYSRTKEEEIDVYLANARRPIKIPNKFSKFRGVHKSGNDKKPYRAAICFKGRRYVIGIFADEIEAAKAYNKFALHLIGSRALLNEIPE
jgi:hypothetical protein